MMPDARQLGARLGTIVGFLVVSASMLWADTGTILPGDWQYRDLDGLAQAGLLSGHPRGALSGWTDRLSRYEAASLVLRAVEGVGKAYQAQGETLQQMAEAKEEAPLEAAFPAGVTRVDLARVEKLIEEFRAELVTMGARADDLAAALKEVQQRLAKVEAEQKLHKIDGYMQLRYQDDSAPQGKEEFQVRRARVNVRGPVSDRTSYRIEFQLDAKESGKARGSKVQLRTAYVDYELDQGKLRVGQAKVPWGYELLESVPNLWTAERSLFMDRLFPDQRDIGVQWSYRRSPRAPQFDVGIFNGTGINASDNNDRKNLMARLDFPAGTGTVALSGYAGSDGAGPDATRQDRTGLSARFEWGQTQFLGEFVDGRDKGHDVRGWYAQLGHPLTSGSPNLLFAKYDKYDENLDLADDLFRRWSLGYWYDLDKATRLTLVWESRDVESRFSQRSKWDGSAYYLQLQTKF